MMEEYFQSISEGFDKAYSQAGKARSGGVDPATFVEIAPAADVAARVEGLTGPPGVAKRIREVVATKSREAASFQIAKEIVDGTLSRTGKLLASPQTTLPEEGVAIELAEPAAAFGSPGFELSPQERDARIEQAVRTGLALFTEGVVSAPIEGISKVEVRRNPDGSEYAAVFFSGPIRGAGGTGQAFALLLADYCRKIAKIAEYRPLEVQVDRYVEECALYARKTRVGQYLATEEEVRHIITHCPVCLDGDPTEEYEVQKFKGIPLFPSNRVRGGMCLVLSEGLCLKAAKVIRIARKAGLDWSWLEKMVKIVKTESKKTEIKPVSKYMDEIVAGRPIFSYPMRAGGWRLRYGRTPYTGIASKAVHPASMAILQDFPAIGTQVKVERPGKGCILTPCQSIEGPVVRLDNGDVVRVDTLEQARGLVASVAEILFLGDLLVNYGDFLKSNHPLVPSGYCEEWYALDLESVGVKKDRAQVDLMGAEESVKLSREKGVALHPRFTFPWHDLPTQDLLLLANWLSDGRLELDWFDVKGLALLPNPPAKRVLEVLLVPHTCGAGGTVGISADYSIALLESLGMLQPKGGKGLDASRFHAAYSPEKDALSIVNEASGLKIMAKAGVYVGSSMGRPEKAKPRKMKPPVNSLFPIGLHGGKMRSIVRAARAPSTQEGGAMIEVEVGHRACISCGLSTWKNLCPSCGCATIQVNKCLKCGSMFPSDSEKCKCGGLGVLYDKVPLDLDSEYKHACDAVEFKPNDVKAVVGLISAGKTPEPIEKGILRAKHGVFAFRDGTSRFDATEIPASHFTPQDAGVGVKELRELGYLKDINGEELTRPDQWLELRLQDVLVPEDSVDYLISMCKFVDDELVYLYKRSPFYNVSKRDELLGQLLICLAPHTSAGVLARIVGFTPVKGLIAHHYLHCATRRNADGDELAFMVLMDGLLNFSKSYLPETRGGRMDAPLVLSVKIDPAEVDDEAHAVDICWKYPLAFYQATQNTPNPSEIKLETIGDRLNTAGQFEGMGFTHFAKMEGPTTTSYVTLGNMLEKVSVELTLMQKIKAVDAPNAAERIILSHFFPDLYGNLRSFSKQSFRCVDCPAKYRRVPLRGKCTRCGGKLLLTINRGGIQKYLQISKEMVARFSLPHYLQQRLMLIEKEIDSVFEDEKARQYSLADYV